MLGGIITYVYILKPESIFKSQSFTKHCVSNPLEWVHDSDRLEVVQECVFYSGTVLRKDDGRNDVEKNDLDLRYVVAPNASYQRFMIQRNWQEGGLQVEVVPAHRSFVKEANVGDTIDVVGTLVFDKEHEWNEIHPCTYLSVRAHA